MKERGHDLEFEVFLVPVSVGPALEDADFVVEPLDQAEADLVLRVAVGDDPVPVSLDHGCELLVGFEPLPLQALLPALEEGAGPARGLVAPELAEGLFEQVGGVEPLVGLEQLAQGCSAIVGEVVAAGEQGVALPLDEGAVLAGETVVLAAPHLVERVTEVAHDVELVEDHPSVRSVLRERVAEGLPHVHRGELDGRALLRAQRGKEDVQVGLGASPAADPGRPAALKVAHHHAVVVALADGDLIDADGPRRGEPGLRDLLLHVDRVEILHRAVVKALQLGHRLVRHLVAERTHVHGEALGVARVLRQPVEPLYVHTTAPRAGDPPALELEVDPPAGHREVAGPTGPPVAAAATAVTAPRAQGGFFRLRTTITRAYRSPNTPPSAEAATKPGSEKRDRIDLGFFMRSTLLQNLHRFQAGRDSRKPLSGEPFMHRLTAEAPT